MSSYESKLEGCEEVADGTMAFHFSKPPGFQFKPGQALEVSLIDAASADAQSASHVFSIVSAPDEERLTIATRMRDSAFKRALRTLVVGLAIKLEGPFGSLTLHSNRTRPAVLIAGGIGITPFVSMLRQAAREQLPQTLVLLYSNRRPEDAAFLAELQALEEGNRNFRLVATMTELTASSRSWPGHCGRIDTALLKQAVGELVAPIYYLAGPPTMVEAMRQTLSLAAVSDDDIRSEAFYGY